MLDRGIDPWAANSCWTAGRPRLVGTLPVSAHTSEHMHAESMQVRAPLYVGYKQVGMLGLE